MRIGIFERETAASDGGADTLLGALRGQVGATAGGAELVRIPWSEWDYRRRPARRLLSRAARVVGIQIPYVDLRGDCRRRGLAAAYFPAPVFARIDVPYVFTLWDIGHRTAPGFPEMREGSDTGAQREALCRAMLPRAAFVVTGTRAGAAEILRYYPVDPGRIAVIPFPNPDFGGVNAVAPSWLPRAPFFLYPAQFWAHKNHQVLLRALALLAQDRKGGAPHLVFPGSDKGHGTSVRALAAELGLGERVHFPGFVSRGELKALYEKAAGLVFASKLGPNNLPPQEAAVLGCPAILSDLPGHREQLGDGALYCAPDEARAWADAMARLLDEPALGPALAERAGRAVAGSTVGACAAKLGALFAKL